MDAVVTPAFANAAVPGLPLKPPATTARVDRLKTDHAQAMTAYQTAATVAAATGQPAPAVANNWYGNTMWPDCSPAKPVNGN